MENVKNLQAYLNQSHSVYHAVSALAEQLAGEGYTRLVEGESWALQPGGKYFFTRNGSALVAFRIPATTPKGFLISASHADRPTFKVKENGELEGKYTRLATEKYGGMLIAPCDSKLTALPITGSAVVRLTHPSRYLQRVRS